MQYQPMQFAFEARPCVSGLELTTLPYTWHSGSKGHTHPIIVHVCGMEIVILLSLKRENCYRST